MSVVIDDLFKTKIFNDIGKDREEQEHSLEMHLPFIQKAFGGTDIKLIPIMVGNCDETLENAYGKLFTKYFEDDNTVFVISSDFCHWGER